VLQLEDQHSRLIRTRRYSEAKVVASTIRELKVRQDEAFLAARMHSQELERARLLKQHARERQVLNARIHDERQKLMMSKKEALELCVRKHHAQVGRAQQKNMRQKCKLQVLF
jgi:uncharacterized membrane protein affecting hemolysin expression